MAFIALLTFHNKKGKKDTAFSVKRCYMSRNWHTRYGELDIVMLNPEYTVVFVEVKSRRSMHYGYPQEAITPAKQHNLRKAACDWLLDRRNRVPHSAVRFDVVTIVLRVGRPLVHHIENAF